MRSPYPRAPLRKAVRRATAALLRLPNVTHVTLGEKLSGDARTGRMAIKAYVSRKNGVPASDEVPRAIVLRDGNGGVIGQIETDVVETGSVPEALGLRSGHVLRAFDNDLGVAGLSFAKGEASYVITNAHVACDIAQAGASGPMGWQDGAAVTPLGPVIFWTPLISGTTATADVAVVRLDDAALADALHVDLIDVGISRMDVIRPQAADYWFVAAGELFRCSGAEPVDGESDVNVDGVIVPYRGFWQLKMTQGLSRKGLSGSLLCRTVGDTHVACGLIFAGLVPHYIWAFPFRPLYERIYNNLPG